MAKVQPLTPSEATAAKQQSLPDEVLEAFNELIAENFDGSQATVKQEDVVNRIIKKFNRDEEYRVVRQEIFSSGYLDIEDIYRKAGWSVSFDKPAYCETYSAYFVFKKKKGAKL